ncbi:MAG: type II secretion system protein GspM [Myxococcota bacterium]
MNELLGRVGVLWKGLAAREQILVGTAGGLVAVILLVFGIVLPVVAATERAVEDADSAERQLAIMHRMKREWDGLHRRLDSVESSIRESGQRENLLTLLESLARQAGVKPTSMEKRQSGESEQYEETKVEVSLKSVTLRQAVDYLSSIEAAAQPLSVKSIRIKRRPGPRRRASDASVDLLDVTF